ncbi:nitric oxide dioxygenase [Nadsonia fulvescens var. elongata DSM 6958]|uniref:nitric oxide dioxygenase n=1 Tax=Nadsonia fulvescens var. elongata DSM 6958 TaxID=857566 RepID=A0A1E3PJ88_9ASCO|nr:nitric oxide dioxygenase [Nadsonia fulvescens var. elongata DSM 6958]
MSLTSTQTEIIKSSVPFLEEKGDELAKHMYDLMFEKYPEVRPLFNKVHQKNFTQPKILAFALLAYAKNIDNISVLGAFVNQIVSKHVGLQILPEHYPIVAECIIQAIKDLLGDAATDDLIEAWTVAYTDLAGILIGAEEAQYSANERSPGGWRGFREFTVSNLIKECDNVLSVELKAKDGKAAIKAKNGQYLGFKFQKNGIECRREYSISSSGSPEYDYRISVCHIPGGVVSSYIHNELKISDIIEVAPPAGNFTLSESESEEVLLIAGGIGITPLISIAESALNKGKQVHLFQCVKSESKHPFKKWAQDLSAKCENFNFTTFYSQDTVIEKTGVYSRRISAKDIERFATPNTDIYALGPRRLMVSLMEYMKSAKYPVENLKTESFGPYQIY